MGKILQKSDSLADGNINNNNNKSKSASQPASGVVFAGSKKAEIIKKLQTKQTKQRQTLILIVSILFISIDSLVLQMQIIADRCAIVVAEYMNIALDFSTYCMLKIITLDQDIRSELDAIYDEAQKNIYPILSEWRSIQVICEEVKLENITVKKIGVGPDMKITNSTADELKLARFIEWIEDAINVMLQLFTYNPEDTTRE
ncbi:MAG: hypothetical protein EZS28_020463 [Streblomastix strix]|uniref:Uncharacterized protein n=1 Tax=Streblomastix strix TaxID=222440 RepID=A0A5J4VNZ8_9EUKA|nr:MAG: hypothetical protein EZS28_020463 [Streblomastix strix]